MRHQYFIGLLLGFVFITTSASAQRTTTLRGRVVNEGREGIPGATIRVLPDGPGVAADLDGNFKLQASEAGAQGWDLEVSAVGYTKQQLTISHSQAKTDIVIRMVEEVAMLQEAVVVAKSEATLMREQAYAISVLEARQFKNTSTDVNQMLGRIAGVNVRQSGGLGSGFTLSLNGLSGNRIRTFINGIPMDYFGSSLTLNNFPANLISSVEVYKGAVPVHLSSDALGGSINITTDTNPTSYLDASYSLGSFRTHRAALNAQWVAPQSGFTLRLKSFFNQSANNYPMQVYLLNPETGAFATEPTEIRRFHDAYSSHMAWLEAGFVGRSWADEFMVGALVSGNTNELQQDPYATGVTSFPLGEVSTSEEKWIYTLSYRKQNLGIQGLQTRAYAVLVNSDEVYVDTAAHRYDWFGNYEPNVHPTTGELGRKSYFTLDRLNALGNVNLEYALAPQHSLAANVSVNHLMLQGQDLYQPQTNTQYSTPNRVNKGVLGFSYTAKLAQDRWHATLFTKQYGYWLSANNPNYQGTEANAFEDQKSRLGYGLATTWKADGPWQFKASFEQAYRFPESFELYGDGLSVIPNPTLQPERSQNYNLGLRWQDPGRVQLDANIFLRETKDYIRFKPQMNRSQYLNDPQVRAAGLDVSLLYTWEKWRLTASGTYLDLRNSDRESTVYLDRLPNEPYLFGNVAATYRHQGLGGPANSLAVSLSQQYVQAFYLDWPSLSSASTKSVIPTQYPTNLEVTYSLAEGRYNVSGQINNLLNIQVYDNFNQPRPGRAFSLKLRYYINQL